MAFVLISTGCMQRRQQRAGDALRAIGREMARPAIPFQAQERLQQALQRLHAGRPAEARVLLLEILRTTPRLGDGLHLLGVCHLQLGDLDGAEQALRNAIAADKRQASFHTSLGEVLEKLSRVHEAEKSYRGALTLNRRHAPAVRQLTELLTRQGRAEEALKIIAPLFAGSPVKDQGLLHAYAEALKGAEKRDAALEVCRSAVAAAPTSAVAEHNLASLLGDMGYFREAEALAAQALAKGLDAPETHLVKARALAGLGRYQQAEAAFQAALTRRPLYTEAHRDYAQMLWMQSADPVRTMALLNEAIGMAPDEISLWRLKAKVLSFTGDELGAYQVLRGAMTKAPDDPIILLAASRAAIAAGSADQGLAYAQKAKAGASQGEASVDTTLCEALLATGDARAAAAIAEALCAKDPHSQTAIAYLATAWRLLSDPRHEGLLDCDRFVRPFTIDAPPGWSCLSSYLEDLRGALNAEHRLKAHPFDQSLRHGSQISQLLSRDEPAILAFPDAVERPIRAFLAELGRRKDPFSSRNLGGYRFRGAWSVKLRPGAGLHLDHIHPEGWVSSACYLEVPSKTQGQEGWIKFGEPGIATAPRLAPVHFVKPEPGLLVLFPSYMWHGTVPFKGTDPRLTVAFDLVP